jgi:hypothetical protein
MGERLAREVRGLADLLIFGAIGEVCRYPRLGAAPFVAPVQPTASVRPTRIPFAKCQTRDGVVGPLENCAVSVYVAMVKLLQ